MHNPKIRQRVPDLVRLATDPHLDAMTRSWVFDALRDLTGQTLPDDPDQWRAWYKRTSGHSAPPASGDFMRFLAWLEN